jgi:superkiller protein 3
MRIEISELEKVLESDPENVEAMVELASLYGEEGEIRKAVDLLDQALALDPENAAAHYNMGVCYLMVIINDIDASEIWEGRADDEECYELATVAFQRALEINPELYEAHNNLGTLYALRSENDQARQHWELSLKINPDQPDVQDDLASL